MAAGQAQLGVLLDDIRTVEEGERLLAVALGLAAWQEAARVLARLEPLGTAPQVVAWYQQSAEAALGQHAYTQAAHWWEGSTSTSIKLTRREGRLLVPIHHVPAHKSWWREENHAWRRVVTGEVVAIDTGRKSIRRAFTEQAESQRQRLTSTLAKHGIDFLELCTSEPYLPTLRRFFDNRERRLSMS